MPELDFGITSVEVEHCAMTPSLRFRVSARERCGMTIENLALQCQFRVEPARRSYRASEQERLRDLFGERERWGETLNSFLWALVPASVPAFAGECGFDLLAPCSFDFNLALTKYFHGLEEGEVPAILLFSGSVFYRDGGGNLQIAQIPWSKEARVRVSVALWREMMDHYHPNSVWLKIGRETFERLYALKQENGAPTLEHALDSLLGAERLAS